MPAFHWNTIIVASVAVLLAACGDQQGDIAPAAEQTVQVGGRTLKPGDAFRDCDNCPEMVVIPAGRFSMGSPANEPGRSPDEQPQHNVTLAKPFAVGKFEVTRAEYTAFATATTATPTPGCFHFNGTEQVLDAARSWQAPGYEQGERDPVVCLDWDEMRAYLQWLSARTGAEYRLLTEAEFEYVARAGTTTARPWGPDIGRGNANCDGCGTDFDAKRTSPAGSFKANAFGVHDMLGNAWERLEDCWHDTYAMAPTDGRAWTVGGACAQRVTRGGAWLSDAPDVRSSLRNWDLATNRKYTLGFRVARAL